MKLGTLHSQHFLLFWQTFSAFFLKFSARETWKVSHRSHCRLLLPQRSIFYVACTRRNPNTIIVMLCTLPRERAFLRHFYGLKKRFASKLSLWNVSKKKSFFSEKVELVAKQKKFNRDTTTLARLDFSVEKSPKIKFWWKQFQASPFKKKHCFRSEYFHIQFPIMISTRAKIFLLQS